MKNESGRSLIEIIGVMAIGAILTVGVVAAYNTIRNRQVRTMATAQLEQIAKDTKLLMELRGDYSGLSVDYLIRAGALKNTKAPIGNDNWSVDSTAEGSAFSINLTGLSSGECEYFTTVKMEWVSRIAVNGNETDPGIYCLKTGDNKVSLIVE